MPRRRCSIKSTTKTNSDDEVDTDQSDTTELSPPKSGKKKAVVPKTKVPEVLEVNIPQRITRRRNTLAAPMPIERFIKPIKKNKSAKVGKMPKAQSDDEDSTVKSKSKSRKSMPNIKTVEVTKSKSTDVAEESSDDEANASDDEEYHRRPMRVRPQDGSPTRNLKIVLEKVDTVPNRKRKSDIVPVVSNKKLKKSDSAVVAYPPNTNIKLFQLHKEYKNRCIICDFESARPLVLHYINEHRDAEVYVSRLASDIACQLMNPRNKLKKAIVDTQKDEMRFRQLCYFCKKEKIFSHQVWLTHIGTHTGEYQFECKKCTFYRSPYALNQASVTHPCTTKKSDWQRLHLSWKADDQVHLYVCKLCNYTQLSEDNVQKHLRVQHEASVDDNYTQVLFLRTEKRFYRGSKKKNTDVANDIDNIDDTTNDNPPLPLPENEITPKKTILNRATRNVASSSTGTTSPYQSDAFTSRNKQDDGLFDDDTMRMMNDVSFSSATTPETPPRNASIADRLNERFKSAQKSEQDEERARKTSSLPGKWVVALNSGIIENDAPSAAIDGLSAYNRERLQKEYEKLTEIDEIPIEFKLPESELSTPVKTTFDSNHISEERADDETDHEKRKCILCVTFLDFK